MAAYKSGTETVLLRREMGGDYGEDVQRETVYGNEGVDPLADGHHRSRGIPVEIRNLTQGEPIGKTVNAALVSGATVILQR